MPSKTPLQTPNNKTPEIIDLPDPAAVIQPSDKPQNAEGISTTQSDGNELSSTGDVPNTGHTIAPDQSKGGLSSTGEFQTSGPVIIETPQQQRVETPVATPPMTGKDSDGDGLTDDKEIELGLDPNKVDSDGDGISDLYDIPTPNTGTTSNPPKTDIPQVNPPQQGNNSPTTPNTGTIPNEIPPNIGTTPNPPQTGEPQVPPPEQGNNVPTTPPIHVPINTPPTTGDNSGGGNSGGGNSGIPSGLDQVIKPIIDAIGSGLENPLGNMPQMPNIPQMPNMPQAPNMPQMPQMPQAPKMPQMPKQLAPRKPKPKPKGPKGPEQGSYIWVADTAILKCDFGTAPSVFKVEKEATLTQSEGKWLATILQHKVGKNVQPFGNCKAQPKLPPCVPALPSPWKPAIPTRVAGPMKAPALPFPGSTLGCTKGSGTCIKIVEPGQRKKKVDVAKGKGGKPTPKEVYDYLRSKGVSDTHAKGIVANIDRESSFRPDVMGDKGTSGGLFQMHAERYDAMNRAVPDWRNNWQGQIDHALATDRAPDYLNRNFSSAGQAAKWFEVNYERPANWVRAQNSASTYESSLRRMGF